MLIDNTIVIFWDQYKNTENLQAVYVRFFILSTKYAIMTLTKYETNCIIKIAIFLFKSFNVNNIKKRSL